MYWIPDPEHPVTKVCSKCGEEKHLMEFCLRYKTGRRVAACNACECAHPERRRGVHAAVVPSPAASRRRR